MYSLGGQSDCKIPNGGPSGVIKWVCSPICTLTNSWGKLKWPYAITRLISHFMCGLMSDLVICKFKKSMVIHDTECPFWDHVSLINNTKLNFLTRFSLGETWLLTRFSIGETWLLDCGWAGGHQTFGLFAITWVSFDQSTLNLVDWYVILRYSCIVLGVNRTVKFQTSSVCF